MQTFIPTPLRRPKFRPARERGQSLVEFSFMVIILTILLLGVLDLGRVYFTYLALLDAAGEGATYASVNPTKWCASSADCPGYVSANPNNITYRVKNSAPEGTMVDWTVTTVLITSDTGPVKPGMHMTVTVTTQYRLLTPFVGSIVGSQMMSLTARATSIVMAPDN